MEMNRRPAIDGKVVIVTGASSGIGESTACEFAQAGAITILAARRVERLKRLENEIREIGGTALAVPTDLIDLDQITNLVKTTLSRFGRIDILANIAGWGLYDWYEELSPSELRQHYEVNVIGLAELTRQVIPTMKNQRSGFILNMSSYVGAAANSLCEYKVRDRRSHGWIASLLGSLGDHSNSHSPQFCLGHRIQQ